MKYFHFYASRRRDEFRQGDAGNCHRLPLRRRLWSASFLVAALLTSALAWGHGGVVMEEDQCVIDIGLFRAHFTIYQPGTRASEEFCEDVPDLGETIFVMDYLHQSLRQMPVDFRIIHDVNDRQGYAAWEDVTAIEDLDAVTVHYQSPRIEPGGALTASHEFEQKGWYIGVVTTRQPGLDKAYRAVFGFHVGGQGLGYWPWLLMLAALVQLHFWVSGGGLRRWRAQSRKNVEVDAP